VGSVRVCGKTCHAAKGAKCRCWCGGLFHGSGGLAARQAFADAFGCTELPTTEMAFNETTAQQNLFGTESDGDRWRAAVAAAVAAREQAGAERRAKRACADTSVTPSAVAV
jgi:hypothetical protein